VACIIFREKPKRSSPKLKGKKNVQSEDHEEIAKKNAMITLATHLGKYYRNHLKRKKFRKVEANYLRIILFYIYHFMMKFIVSF